MRDVLEYQIPVPVGEGDLQVRLYVQSSTPCDKLLPCGIDRGIERGSPWIRLSRRKGVCRIETPAPVQSLNLPVLVNPEDIRHVSSVDAEDLCLFVEVNRGCFHLGP